MSTTPNEPEDELAGTEQPFVAHLVELRDRLIKAFIAVGIVAAVLAVWPGPGALYDLLAPYAELWAVEGIGASVHGPVHASLARVCPDPGSPTI